jgi:hypothetical protein
MAECLYAARRGRGVRFGKLRRRHYAGVENTPIWQLDVHQDAPTLPYGYQTMALIALTPPLWRHMMRPLLADWDKRFASKAERAVVRERGWKGVA